MVHATLLLQQRLKPLIPFVGFVNEIGVEENRRPASR